MKANFGLFAAAVVFGACSLTASVKPAQAMTSAAIAIAQYEDRSWEAPPGELDEIARRGFHAGIEGARKDYGNHRRPDVNNRDEYRHPDVRRRDREAYRRGFERGYNVGVEHLYNRR